jgi:hypothetical protein
MLMSGDNEQEAEQDYEMRYGGGSPKTRRRNNTNANNAKPYIL